MYIASVDKKANKAGMLGGHSLQGAASLIRDKMHPGLGAVTSNQVAKGGLDGKLTRGKDGKV